MPRPPKFTASQILDAAQDLVAAGGPRAVTVAAISEALGAPSGSIYHRFASRDLVLAHLWIRAVRRSQEGFVAALARADPEAPIRAALHLGRWSREHPTEAQVAVLYRREDLAGRWPSELGAELERLNDDVAAAIQDYARRRYGRAESDQVARVTFAVVDIPYAAVRRHLVARRPPPESVDPLVEEAVRHLLGL